MTRIAVFGGVCANPFATGAMLADARERGCERSLCLGDLGGFGAECDAIWPLLGQAKVQCIAANYDVAIGRGDPDCGAGTPTSATGRVRRSRDRPRADGDG